MHCLLILTALIVSAQPQPSPSEQSNESEQLLSAFEAYSFMASTVPAIADDGIDDGLILLFYRVAHFVRVYGKATPKEAIEAAKTVVQFPGVGELGTRLNSGPLEIEKREGATADADFEWVTSRGAALMGREDFSDTARLITDLNLPLPGRVRLDILSEKDRDQQINTRFALIMSALKLFRDRSGNQAELSDVDFRAASELVQEQFARDYIRINGYLVPVRGNARFCARMDVEAVARTLLEWVGPPLKELEGVRNLTLAPVDSGWVVVDADTGWSLRDPTIGKFSNRDVLMLQKGLEARGHPNPATTGGTTGEFGGTAGGGR